MDNNNTNVSDIATNKAQNTIVEAQGCIKNKDGSMELVAMAPNTNEGARIIASGCPTN